MDVAQTRADRGSTQIMVIGQKSLFGDLRPVLRALGLGILLGLVGMLLLNALAR
ncbi:MAG TPA: hypothetical protein VFQ35_07560 [Polyangiaceae bacterium]|nr:hypothetical protein [Polyangiaceae bacterium]